MLWPLIVEHGRYQKKGREKNRQVMREKNSLTRKKEESFQASDGKASRKKKSLNLVLGIGKNVRRRKG